MFILIGARVFSLTFYGVNGHIWVEHLLTSLPGGEVGFLIGVNILVFLLAFFLDFFELAFIIVPLLAPAADKLGIDLIWFGVLLGVNMQTSFMHPRSVRAVLFALGGGPCALYRSHHQKADRAGYDRADLLGRRTFRDHPGDHGIVIMFPQLVMHYKGEVVDPGSIEIKVPDMPGLTLPGAPPTGGAQPASPGADLSTPPSFGNTPAQPAQPAPPATDLSQPPTIAPAQPASPPANNDLSKPPSFN
jgi:hypothetical protein